MTQYSNRIGLALGVVIALVAGVFLFRSAGAAESVRAANVAVTCGQAQRAVVRQIVEAGVPRVDVQCADGVAAPTAQDATYVLDPSGRLVEAAGGIGVASAASYVPGPVTFPAVYQPAPVREIVPAPVRARAPRAVRAASTTVSAQSKPSWQKRALIIGGSAGAGAGVGALVGGKKGALIGAAVGGGGAAVVDALRNR